MELKLAYLVFSLVVTSILIWVGVRTIDKSYTKQSGASKKKIILIGSIVLWHIYVFALASSGFMLNLDFPPRFALFTIIPLFLFSGIFVFRNRNKSWIQNIPPSWLFLFQAFRILIETLFVFTVANGILHPNVTIEGYNYDMIYAFTVLIIGVFTYSNFTKYKRLILWWNYLGLAVIAFIIFLFMSTIYIPEIYGDIAPFPIDFLRYPYVLVASFLMPSAVFVHLVSIAQLRR